MVSLPPALWTLHPKLQGSPPLATRDPNILVISLPTSTPRIPISPGRRKATHPRGSSWRSRPGPLGTGPLPAPLTCDRGKAEQQHTKEEGGDQQTNSAGRHGAAPGRVQVRAAAAGMGFNRARGGRGVGAGPSLRASRLCGHCGRPATSCRFTILWDQVSLLAPVGTRNLFSFQPAQLNQLQPDPSPLASLLLPPGA